MTTYAERPALKLPTEGLKPTRKGHAFVKWVTTTDHKRIGYMYLITTFAWFLIGGFLALLLRSELARPGLQFLSNTELQYNLLSTILHCSKCIISALTFRIKWRSPYCIEIVYFPDTTSRFSSNISS